MRTTRTMLALFCALACLSVAGCRKDGGAQPETAAVPAGGGTTAPTPTEPAMPADAATAPTPPPTEPAPAATDAAAPTASTEPPPTADAAPAGPDGQALVQARCARCHSVDRVNRQASRDPAYWTDAVQKMVRNGARLDAAEQQAVIDYLAGRP